MTHHVRWRAIARARGWSRAKVRGVASNCNAALRYSSPLCPSHVAWFCGNQARAIRTSLDLRRLLHCQPRTP